MDTRVNAWSLSPSPADVESALKRHVIDVWFPRCLDRHHGGFLCDYDSRWRTCGTNEKLLEFQARHTWFAAEASQIYPEDESLEARSVKSSEPVYLQAGTAAPEGLDQSRIVWIERVLIDPPEQPAEQLPEVVEPSPAIEKVSPSFTRPLAEPELGIV